MQPLHLNISEFCSSAHTSINFGPINFPPSVCSQPQINFASPSRERLILYSQQLISAWTCSPASTLHPPPSASAPAQPSHCLLLQNSSFSSSQQGSIPGSFTSCLTSQHCTPIDPMGSRADLNMTWVSLSFSVFKVQIARLKLHLLDWPVKVMVRLKQPPPKPFQWGSLRHTTPHWE